MAGCAVAPKPPPAAPPPVAPEPAPSAPDEAALPAARAGAAGKVAGRNERVLVYLPTEGDTLEGVAERFLGAPERAWQIAQANAELRRPQAGEPLVVPLQPPPAHGVGSDSLQTIPVLCYHRFGSGPSKMIMPPANFEAQLQWLAENHVQVLRLAQFVDFLAGRAAQPPRSVVLTVDDGYESFYRLAYPLLRKYAVPATLFIYTDIVGTRDGLSWAQLREMAASGLVDIQAHSRSHRNLGERAPGETDAAYRQALINELRQPRLLLERQLADVGVRVRHFAYPYGESNEFVLEALQREGYELAFTVQLGGNPFFAAPRLLRRTMIYGDHDLEDFKARVLTQRSLAQP